MAEENGEKKPRPNYPGNSHKQREPREEPKDSRKRKVDKVISGGAVQRKKPLGRKIAETFAGEDVPSVGSYILFDVVIPAAKSMISDAVSQGIERMLFGESRRRTMGGSRGGSSGYTTYNRMYTGSTRSDLDRPGGSSRELSKRARASHNFEGVVLETRGEAEEVIDRLRDLVDQYDVATVSDLYDLVGITGSFVDDKWGWTDLRGSHVRPVREGYLLELPKTEPLD